MGYLLKKMLRDIRSNWTQFVSVFLMAMISVLIFSGMASVWTGLNSEVDAFVKETNMADLWVRAMSVTEDDWEAIKDLKEVETASRCMSASFSVTDSSSELQVSYVDNDTVSHPLLIAGVEYDNEAQDGIWIDQNFAEKNNLRIGDRLRLDGLTGEAEFEVKGTIMSPEAIYYTGSITETVPNYEKYGYAFVSEAGMLRLSPQILFTQLKLKTTEKLEDSALEAILGERYICTQDTDTYIPFARSHQESSQIRKMAILFSSVFILLALMTMYTSMVRLVNRQKTLIGTLKALGTGSNAIRLHYACYGLVIPILGGILGLIIGRYTVSPALMKVKQSTIYLPQWSLIHSPASFALIGVIAVCCVFASVWAAQKCLKGMPVDIMRDNAMSKTKKSAAKETGFAAKLSYEWRWTLRNIWQNKIRFLMGIVGVVGGMVLMIAGFGVKDAINGSNDFVFSQQFHYETKAILAPGSTRFDWDEESQWIQEANIELKTKHNEVKQTIMTVCDEGDMLAFYNSQDEECALPQSGAVISRKLAHDLGIEPGDTVEVRVFGVQDWLTVTIVDTVKTLSPQSIFLSKQAYEALDMSFQPSALLTASMDTEALKSNPQIKSVITRQQQIDNTNTIAESVMTIVKLLIVASVVLSVVILYNLGILSYVERIRDYATMKVLGFYQKEIRSIAIRECLLTTVIGWIIGLPLGVEFLKLYIRIISFDTFEWIAAVQPMTLVIASAIIVGVSIGVNLLLSRKVKKIVMVEALKSVD